MDISERQRRIGEIQSLIPTLQQELEKLLEQLRSECRHPYGIGWKITTRELIMTRGQVGCPECGHSGFIDDKGYEIIPPPALIGRQIHWIPKDLWDSLFDKSTLSNRLEQLNGLGLDKPPVT